MLKNTFAHIRIEHNQKIAMDPKLMKSSVMDAKIDPKVVIDLSIFKSGGCNELQAIDLKTLDKFIDENMPWLLVGISSRDPFIRTVWRNTLRIYFNT